MNESDLLKESAIFNSNHENINAKQAPQKINRQSDVFESLLEELKRSGEVFLLYSDRHDIK